MEIIVGYRRANFRPSAVLLLTGILTACAAAPPVKVVTRESVLAKDDNFIVKVAESGDSYAVLAKKYHNDASKAWLIEEANEGNSINPGSVIIIPKKPQNRVGVRHDGYQIVPILSYHRFGSSKGKLTVSRDQFEEQMRYIERNDFTVISLSDLLAFLRAERALPKKSVVLTIDDGYRSTYHIAFPVLAKFGFAATVFVYSDYIGNGGLTWKQMTEMEESGLISFQAHSKTHDNLTIFALGESLNSYKARLEQEVGKPLAVLRKRIAGQVNAYAYPYGATNKMVVDELTRKNYALGATVDRGSNPFFAYPYTLRRTMIYRSDDISKFSAALQTFHVQNLR